MPTTTIRWAVTEALITQVRAHASLVGVAVEPGWPGDQAGSETVWVDDLDGDINIPTSNAGRKQRDDKFRIPFEVRVVGKVSLDATMTRLAEIVAALEDVLANSPTLSDTDGVVAAQVTEERMTSADLKGLGHVGFAEVVVSVHARLT